MQGAVEETEVYHALRSPKMLQQAGMYGKHLVQREMLDHRLLRQQPAKLLIFADGFIQVSQDVRSYTVLTDKIGNSLRQET